MELQRVDAGSGRWTARNLWLWGGGRAWDLVTAVGVFVRVGMQGGERIIRERNGHRPQMEIQRVLPGVRRRVTTWPAGSFLEVRGHAGVQRVAEWARHAGNSPGRRSRAE